MIRHSTLSVVALLSAFCIALVQNSENATVISNTTENAVEQTIGIEEATNSQQVTDPVIERSSHFHHIHEAHYHKPSYHGFWKKKLIWRPRWVKTWQEKKVYVAVWKRMWSPAMFNEWLPIPKPPPGWIKHNYGSLVVQKYPH